MAAPPAQTQANRPLVTAIVMLIGAVTGLPIFVAAIMAYLFKGEAPEGGWERTHYSYHIRTFWVSVLIGIIGGILVFAGIGVFILMLLPVWVFIRALLPLLRAANGEAMPNPYSWMF